MQGRKIWTGWLLVFVLAVFATSGSGEIVRLPDGSFLQGELLESDQHGFVLKRWDTGGVVKLSWEQIHPEDRTRLRKALGLEFSDMEQRITIEASRLHLKTGDMLEGKILEQTDSFVRVRRSTGEFKYPAEVIKRIEPIEMDILSIYSQEEAYALHTEEKEEPETADAHYDLATWCRKLGYFEMEKKHLVEVQALAPAFKPTFIRNRLEALEDLVREAQVRRRIEEIMRMVARKEFQEAYAAWEEAREAFPESEIIQDDTENVMTGIEQAKVRYMQSVVVRDWYKYLRWILRKRALDKEMKLADAKKILHKELTEEIVAKIVEDRGLKEDEIKNAFEEREVYNVHKATYGTGTFIVEKGSRYGKSGSSGLIDELGKRFGIPQGMVDQAKKKYGKSSSGKKQKTLSPEEWWKVATADMKFQWMLAYYAENSGVMQIVRIEEKPCPPCQGRGYVTYIAAGGGSSGDKDGMRHSICTRCQGLGKDRIVVYK